MKTIIPPALQLGDTIGVMAPSSYVEREDIEKSVAAIEAHGYKVFVHPQTYERENQSAGSHLQKSLAFQGLWQRDNIKAIWAAGGGNRALHLLDQINFSKLKDKPKALIGFSDVTALLNAVHAHTGLVTYHAQVFKNLHKNEEHIRQTLNMVSGQDLPMVVDGALIINKGSAEGRMIGGNLSVFQYLPQTLPNDFCDGAILFLEDCNEDLSKIDRMILHLKRTGIFTKAAGIVFGEFTRLTDSGRPFGYTLEDIIREHTTGLDIPIIMNAPFGHGTACHPIPVGQNARVDTNDEKIIFLN